MERRLYFVVGDIVANAGVGVAAALAAAWLTGERWHPLAAMPSGMLIGMVVAMMGSLVLTPLFGGFEVMLPTLLSGMWAGMYAAMAEAMGGVAAGPAARAGAVIGILVWLATSLLNARLRSPSVLLP